MHAVKTARIKRVLIFVIILKFNFSSLDICQGHSRIPIKQEVEKKN